MAVSSVLGPTKQDNDPRLKGRDQTIVCDDEEHQSDRSVTTVQEEERLARNETKAVNGLRFAVVFLLTAVAIAVSLTSFFFIRNEEVDDFETAFADQAERVFHAFEINAKRRVTAIESFALSITSHAKSTNSTWPFVTLPNFERRGVATTKLAEVMSIVMAPFVTDETRADWEEYSVENQEWLQEGLDVGGSSKGGYRGDVASAIPNKIYRVEGLAAGPETGPGPYLPQWQIAPVVPVPGLVNFNLLSHPGYQESLNALLAAKVAIVGRSFDFSDPDDTATAGRRDVFGYFLSKWKQQEENVYDDDPIADLHVPLYDDFDEETRTLVGLLTCVVYWRTYFVDILPENSNGIRLVLKNTCDQAYTYQINGPRVKYVGSGEIYDRQYKSLGMATDAGAFLPLSELRGSISGSCLYSIDVYPSQEFESTFVTSKPKIYTGVLAGIFLFASLVFWAYDCLVERRQRIVMSTAVASSAIVSSLFPKLVRDRLYHKDKEGATKMKKVDRTAQAGDARRLQKLVSSLDQRSRYSSQDGKSRKKVVDKPIADLFENVTVLFADIAGFTAWSSGRQPSDVFTLLETIYGAFDTIGKRRRVFKVETIGDCYLAVTGLPEPQEDHATTMCLFANECLRKMRFLMRKELKDLMGGDTDALSMRFGLNSGPVIAGVLRGEKSRFQLFGDTVNTAARMESTGERNKIQLSQATADVLVSMDMGFWLDQRADIVEAKGKGHLQTYWLNIRNEKGPSRRSGSPRRQVVSFHAIAYDHSSGEAQAVAILDESENSDKLSDVGVDADVDADDDETTTRSPGSMSSTVNTDTDCTPEGDNDQENSRIGSKGGDERHTRRHVGQEGGICLC